MGFIKVSNVCNLLHAVYSAGQSLTLGQKLTGFGGKLKNKKCKLMSIKTNKYITNCFVCFLLELSYIHDCQLHDQKLIKSSINCVNETNFKKLHLPVENIALNCKLIKNTNFYCISQHSSFIMTK